MNFGKWVGFVALALSLYVLWQVRQLLLLLFTAVVLANALNILVKRCQKWGIRRQYAVLLVGGISLATLVGFFWLLVPPLLQQLEEIAQLVPRGIERLSTQIELLLMRLEPDLLTSLPDINELLLQWQPTINKVLGGGLNFFYSSLGALLGLLLLLVLTFMFLADPQPYRQGFIRFFPSFYRRRVDEILNKCQQALQEWLTDIAFSMASITVLSWLVLLLLGLKLALAQAVLTGLLTFIPYIGPVLSVIAPSAIALLEAPWKALAVPILYFAIQQVEGNLLVPLVRIRKSSVLPAISLLAQVFFASFFGLLGLFLALPLTIVAQVWLTEVLVKDILDRMSL